MKLYSFQPMFVWDCLQELGSYHPHFLYEHDTSLKEEEGAPWSFRTSYDWLREAMLERGVKYYHNNEHMIWAWHCWGGSKQPIPDKRYSAVFNYFKDEPYVMLELDIDESRVCLTDYDAWHFVLNYWYLGKTRESDRFNKTFDYYKQKPQSDMVAHKTMSQSWSRIFDMKESRDILQITKKQQQIQATFFELFYQDVTRVHFFDKKRCQSVLELKKA